MTEYPAPGAQPDPASTPPGWGPPAPPPPSGWGPPGPPPGGGAPGAGWGRPPQHQPGVVPLRPLNLGDIFGGALATVRRNPRATIGMALVVSLVFMLVPILATAAAGAAGLLALDGTTSLDAFGGGQLPLLVATAVGALFSGLSGIVVTGLIVRVVEQAVIGVRITAGEAWAASRDRMLPLLGLTVLIGLGGLLVVGVPVAAGAVLGLATGSSVAAVLLGVLGLLFGLVLAVFLYVRYVMLAPAVLVLEGVGIRAAIARSGTLRSGQAWRLFGIFLLASLAAAAVSQVVAIPLGIVGATTPLYLPDSWSLTVTALTGQLSSVLTGALVGPFTAGVLALQYLDQRFRKEGLDIELLQRSLGAGGLGPPPGGPPPGHGSTWSS